MLHRTNFRIRLKSEQLVKKQKNPQMSYNSQMSYRRKLKIDCTAKMSNPSVKKLEIQKQHITNIKKEAVIIFFFTM